VLRWILLVALSSVLVAQPAAAPAKKRLLITGEEKGCRHEAVSHAMSTIERLGPSKRPLGYGYPHRHGMSDKTCCLPLTAAGRFNLGIGTYSYHSLSMDDTIVQLKELRIRQIEMSRGEFMLFSKPAPELFRSARARFDNAGIQRVSYYTATIKDDRDLDDAVRGPACWGPGISPGTPPAMCCGGSTNDVQRRA
jgi:hypothetical protein